MATSGAIKEKVKRKKAKVKKILGGIFQEGKGTIHFTCYFSLFTYQNRDSRSDREAKLKGLQNAEFR